MDDAVGDALALLVQLRNLFMFLLRILMSSRR
jgi:FtsH-binding integral membrane protein